MSAMDESGQRGEHNGVQRVVKVAVFVFALAGITAFVVWSVRDSRPRQEAETMEAVAPGAANAPGAPGTSGTGKQAKEGRRGGGATPFRIRPEVAPTPAAPAVKSKSPASPAAPAPGAAATPAPAPVIAPVQLPVASVPKTWTAPAIAVVPASAPAPAVPPAPRSASAAPSAAAPVTPVAARAPDAAEATAVTPETAGITPVVLRPGGFTTPYRPVHTHGQESSLEAVVPLPLREIFDWDDPKYGAVARWVKAWEARLAAGKLTGDVATEALTSLLAAEENPLPTVALRQLGHAAEFLEPGPLAIVFYRAAIQRAARELAGLAIDSPEARRIGQAITLCYMPFWTSRDQEMMEQAFGVMLRFQPAGSYEAYKCATYATAPDYNRGAWRGDKEAAKRALAAYHALLDDPAYAKLPANEIGQIHMHLGYLYHNTGQFVPSLRHLKAGLADDDYQPELVFPMIVRAAARTGQFDEAKAFLERYTKLDKKGRESVESLTELIESARATAARRGAASAPATQP